MRRMLVLAATLAAVPVGAQVSEDIITAYVGNWLVLPVDGRPGCAIAMTAEETIGGRSAVPADDCVQHVPAIADASAWYPAEQLRFTDPIRRVVMSFDEDETALLSSPSVAEPLFYLVPARPGLTHLQVATAMPGGWSLAAGAGKPICTLALAAPAAGEDGGALQGMEGCRKGVVPAGLKRWRREALDLYFEGDGDAMLTFRTLSDDRFATDDDSLVLQRAPAR